MVELSIKRPVFITCLFTLIIIVGVLSLRGLSVDLFPDVTFPIVRVLTGYPGAGPSEIETLITKPIEDELSSLSGIKTLSSISQEGTSIVIAEFNLTTDIKYAEQQIRDRISKVKNKIPEDAEESIVSRIDPSDQPVMMVAVESDLPMADLFDIVDQEIKPRIEQVDQVGLVEILGGRKKEIRVELDLNKISERELAASSIRATLATTGKNTPAGKIDRGDKTNVIRTLGEYKSIQEIKQVPISYANFQKPITIGEVADVVEGLEEEKSRTFVNGKAGMLVQVYRQSGSNTVKVVESVRKKLEQINPEIKGKAFLKMVQDGSKPIRANIADVKESILIGIALTIMVVFLFLASFRSTLITSLALPNSLLGAFVLMALAGFSINIMTLLALSLAVGLLIDDAIVVRENIYRHIEMGKPPRQAAIEGTREVLLAVIATTMTVIAVFGPIGFLQGVVGQFFKEFGLTICFAMLISLVDAITMAPMLSAYFAGKSHSLDAGTGKKKEFFIKRILMAFDRFQSFLENKYVSILEKTLNFPKTTLMVALGIFVASIWITKFIPKTFLPPQDNGEFMVALDLPPGTSLDRMTQVAQQIDQLVREHKEVLETVLSVGNAQGESNKANFFVTMVPSKERSMNTTQFKDQIRQQLKPFAYANPVVKDQDRTGGGQRPFNLFLIGTQQVQLEKVAKETFDTLKKHSAFLDVDSSYRPGKPEIQVDIDPVKAAQLGVLNVQVGQELRSLVEGVVPAVYRKDGREYDVRIRLREDQRDIQKFLQNIRIPNMNNRLTYLKLFADVKNAEGPMTINRQDRVRYISINADIAPQGPGMGGAIADVTKLLEIEKPLPPGMKYKFVGQAENFKELIVNMMIAMGLGVLFIYMVLASLYESFITPLTIMLVLPLAACGAFFALAMTQSTLDIFSMIGCVMLLGIATKNSIILVDYINQMIQQGSSLRDAILKSGRTRLRPIIMTSFALISGMLPVAIGLNEASKQRTSMGIAIIGGLVSSTLLTLVVVPAAYGYIERARLWGNRKLAKVINT